MRKLFPVLLLLCGLTQSALAENPSSALSFDYELVSNTYFDNRENDMTASPFTPSSTLFGEQLTPQVGLRVKGDTTVNHRFMVGLDATFYFGMKDKPFGQIDKVLAYYKFDKKFRGGRQFTVLGGVFPKTYYRGTYTRAFVSDSLRFTGRNCQGMLISYESPQFFGEIICNWIGIKKGTTRERFQIWSSFRYDFLPWLRLAADITMDHYACSEVADNVVDNFLVRPYLGFDFSSLVPMQRLYVDIGGYASYQRDRRFEQVYWPGGVELNAEIRHWNVGVRNTLYVGTNLEPLGEMIDPAGTRYGHRLYLGEHYYRVRMDGSADRTMMPYDRLEIFYEPALWPGVKLDIRCVFHFNGPLSGTQQIIGLKADLNKILKK